MALSTRRECHECDCLQPDGEPGSRCWTCDGRIGRSSGRDYHSSQMRSTYTEQSGRAWEGELEQGRDSYALALPGGYCKRVSSNGGDYLASMAMGGSSGFAYAHASPGGMFASAGPGGHAVAVSGSGSGLHATIMGPRGHFVERGPDGSTRRGRVTYSDGNQGAIRNSGGSRDEAIRNIDEHYGASRYIDEDPRPIRHGDANRGAPRYGDEELGPTRRDDENHRAFSYSKKKEAITYGNENRKAIAYRN